MANMRPIDELPDDAKCWLEQYASIVWIRDDKGIDYQPPKWLGGLLRFVWDQGYEQCQSDIREALGFVQPAPAAMAPQPAGDDCGQGATGKVEVANG